VESIEVYLKNHYRAGLPLGDALRLGRDALTAAANGAATIAAERLEVCTLDRERAGRKFRRASADEGRAILAEESPAEEQSCRSGSTVSRPSTGSSSRPRGGRPCRSRRRSASCSRS